MPAAVGVVRIFRTAALVPAFTSRLFTIEEHEPVRYLRLLFSTAKHAPDLEQRRHRGARIVRAEKLHVLVILRIVMARDQDQCPGLTGNLTDDVCHLLVALRRSGSKFIQVNIQPRRFQFPSDVSARLGELGSVRRAWSEVDLLAHVVHRSFAIESCNYGRRNARLARTG